MEKLERFEEIVLKVIEDCMEEYGDGFSDVTVQEIADFTGLQPLTVIHTLEDLIKKGFVDFQDVNGEYNVFYSKRWMAEKL